MNGVSTGTVTLVARIGIGLYDAARVTLTTAGNYAITHASMTMLGNRLFVVRPLAVTKIVVDVPNNMAITLGDANAAITVIYKDRYNNGSEPTSFPTTIRYTGLNVASTGTLQLVRTVNELGIVAGTAKAQLGVLTMAGDYTFDFPMPGFPITGIQTVHIIGREPERAEISGLPQTLCGAAGDIDVTVRFFDALGMPTNYYPTSVRYALFRGGVEVQQGMLEYVAEIAPGVLRYRLRAPFAPGEYRLRIPSPTIVPEDVTGTVVMEVCSPPAALSVVGANISPGVNGSTSCIVAGQSLTGLRVNVLDAFGLNTFGVAALSAQYQGITCVSSGTLTLVSTATRGVFLEAVPPTIFTTAGTYRLTVSTNGSFSATTLGTFCVEPDAPSWIKLLSTPLTCVTAGNALAPLALRITDQFGNTSGTVSQATFSADAPIVSTGTLQLRTSTTGVVTQAPPLAIFSTAATYTLTLPVSYRGNAVSLPPVSFCVQPAPAAVGTLSLVLPAIPQNSTQASLLTVRDYWGNLTTTTSTVLNFSGAASGRIALTPQSTGIYRGANTQFATQGTYSLQAGTLEMRGQTTFNVVPRPTITALSPMINNTTLATFIAWTMTVTGTGFTPDSEVRILDVANNLIGSVTKYVSPTQLRYIVPESQADRSGVFAVTVVNPHGQGGTSASVQLRITPRINAGLSNRDITVFGSSVFDRNLPIYTAFPQDTVTIPIPGVGFDSTAVVLWNDSIPLVTTYINQRLVWAKITQARTMVLRRDIPITVRNSTQATLTSNRAPFSIIAPFRFSDTSAIWNTRCGTPRTVSFSGGQFRIDGQQEYPIGFLAQDHIPPAGVDTVLPFNMIPRRIGQTNMILQYQNTAAAFGYSWFSKQFGTSNYRSATAYQSGDEMDLIIPLTRQYLNGIDSVGLKAIVDLPRYYAGWSGRRLEGAPRPIEEIVRFVDSLKNHCGVLGWYIADEPKIFVFGEASHYKNPANLRALYNAIRAADANHPIFIVSFAPTYYWDTTAIIRGYDSLFYNPAQSRLCDVILRENPPFLTVKDTNSPLSDCSNPNVPCYDMYRFNRLYQTALGNTYINNTGISAIGLTVSEANGNSREDSITRAPRMKERIANNFAAMYFAQLPKSATRQPNIAAMLFNNYSMSVAADGRPNPPVPRSVDSAEHFINFFMNNNLDKIVAAPQGRLTALTTFLPGFPFKDHQMLVMEREWGDSFYIIAINMVNKDSVFQTVPRLELSWQTTTELQPSVTSLLFPGMPTFAAPRLATANMPDYMLIDSTPFQPAETRIYRIRKQGMLLAEKSSSALSSVTSPLVQPTRPIAREERRSQTTLRIYPNPAEDKAAISVTLDSPQRIRLILTDVLGRTIQTIYEGESNSGELVFSARLDAIPNGVYWLRLFTEKGVQTVPLSIQK